MKFKLIIAFILFEIVTHRTRCSEVLVNDAPAPHCHLNLEKLMNFLYGNQCVQIISDIKDRLSVNCVADMMKRSKNVTIFIRSIGWIKNRNIYNEEIISNSVQNVTTRFCENYLIFLKNIHSVTSIVTTIDPKNTTKNFFPFSKIYFLIENLNESSHEIEKISNLFHKRSLFGYIVEFDELTSTLNGIRDLLTLNYTVTADYPKTNLIHPFVDRKNTKKVFRISFHECFPYVIYADEKNLR